MKRNNKDAGAHRKSIKVETRSLLEYDKDSNVLANKSNMSQNELESPQYASNKPTTEHSEGTSFRKRTSEQQTVVRRASSTHKSSASSSDNDSSSSGSEISEKSKRSSVSCKSRTSKPYSMDNDKRKPSNESSLDDKKQQGKTITTLREVASHKMKELSDEINLSKQKTQV